jgi:hypothetical protein
LACGAQSFFGNTVLACGLYQGYQGYLNLVETTTVEFRRNTYYLS